MMDRRRFGTRLAMVEAERLHHRCVENDQVVAEAGDWRVWVEDEVYYFEDRLFHVLFGEVPAARGEAAPQRRPSRAKTRQKPPPAVPIQEKPAIEPAKPQAAPRPVPAVPAPRPAKAKPPSVRTGWSACSGNGVTSLP